MCRCCSVIRVKRIILYGILNHIICLSIKCEVLATTWEGGTLEHLPIFEILPKISSFSLSLVAEQFHLTSLNWFWHSRIPLSAAVFTCFMWSNLKNYLGTDIGVQFFCSLVVLESHTVWVIRTDLLHNRCCRSDKCFDLQTLSLFFRRPLFFSQFRFGTNLNYSIRKRNEDNDFESVRGHKSARSL